MKKYRLLLVILLVFITTGCTISIHKEDKSVEEKEEETVDEEDVEDEKITSMGIVSDSNNPLTIGTYGLASKYNVYLGEYKDVDVSLKTIYEDPDTIISDYNLSNPDNKIEKEDGYKYVILDYEVIFFDFETESFGDNIRLDVEIVDISNNNFVVDGVKQVIKTYVLEEELGVFDGGKGTVKIAFAIPEDTVNYLVKFGTYDHTIAYYKV